MNSQSTVVDRIITVVDRITTVVDKIITVVDRIIQSRVDRIITLYKNTYSIFSSQTYIA